MAGKYSEGFGGGLSAEPLAEIELAVDLSAINKGVESVTTPGACSPAMGTSKLTVDGTDAVTLAAGLVVGQRKHIVMVSGATTPIAVITPVAYADGTTVSLAADGSVILEWDGTTWHTVGGSATTIA